MITLCVQFEKGNSNSHRGRFDIIADILEASYDETRKTYLMYRCNMSFRQLKYYLDFLLVKGLLCMVAGDVSADRGLFEITSKGKEFLRAYKGLKALVK